MSDPEQMIVTLTIEQLAALVRDVVRAELDARKPAEPAPLLTPREAAEILQLSTRQVQALCASGELPAERYGLQWRIRREDLTGGRDAA